MSEQRWLVIRCPSCSRCTGHLSIPRSCKLCGQPVPKSTKILAEVASAALLQQAVALANTPEELREELAMRMEVGDSAPSRDTSMAGALLALRQAADGDVIEATEILRILRSLDVSASPLEFMSMVEHEGLVLRLGPERWQFIE